ncbi:phosphatase PAP2 family protein [Mucilaginibacter mali]|uniref:Phosphatase PAP2 family protein n=1 Tax=Mucilaginibacter mali TaxID=2740462 RepID=A0A7D4UEJ2_9SPHI|nr:phosphatase PAP2 family protein [Mucilaginibacter mali]QKJ31779.1 phosphatase PAP2 family protein [Mucilaginibacter mali]
MTTTPFEKTTLAKLFNKVWLFLVPYLLILTGCLIIKSLYTREQIYFYINGLHTNWGDVVFPFFTMLGDGLALITLAAIIALFSYRRAFLLISGYLFTALFAQVLKFMFDMPRPYLYFKDMHSKMHFVKGIDMLSYHSFPSGHTVTAFSACLTLAYLFRNKFLDVLMLALACCIGYSRMYLSQHFFEDVTAGSAVGVFVTLFWLYWLDNKHIFHTERWRGGLIRRFGN